MRHLPQLLRRSLAYSSLQAGHPAQRFGARAAANAQNVHTSPFLRLFARHPERIPNLRGLRLNRRPYSNTSNSGATASSNSSNKASLSLSARLRKLSREYGWSAFGVYMAFSALDFPFCFLAVRSLGTERIGEWEHAIVEWVKRAIPFQWPEKWGGPRKKEPPVDLSEEYGLAWDHGVKEAEAANMGETASIWTQLALAYAIHKSFIFIRVPLTAAVTPKVVRTLRGWGWNIGKIKPKAERVAAKAERQAVKAQKKAQDEVTKLGK